MSTQDNRSLCDLGMIGLGVMGRNLLLNMVDHGFTVAGFDTNLDKVKQLQQESNGKNTYGADDVKTFIGLLKKPRAIMFLIPAGKPVDMVIDELIPLLEPGDIIIDGGNSHFTDTNARFERLKKYQLQFLGVGISGGEEGARRGPSIMPGGPQGAYERIRPIFEAVSAKVNQDPCVAYLGEGSAGHYVKMVHNGIEYGIMQLIAESYDLMKRGLGMNNAALHKTFTSWNNAELNSYLIEITADIFSQLDDQTHKDLLDEIKPIAKQLGTGMWTSLSSMELQCPTPTIDIAVSMRDLSVLVDERRQASTSYPRPFDLTNVQHAVVLKQLQHALYTSMIITYAQGMALLATAAKQYQYTYNLESVARIWRGGCIIRSQLLEDFRHAFTKNPQLPHLLLDPTIAKTVMKHQEDLRHIVNLSVSSGIAMPAFSSAISYFDAYRSAWQPANLIQAQRDFFGAHTYERIDMKGTFHTEWDE